MSTVSVYSFTLKTKIVTRGYYVYKKTSWSKAWDGEEVKVAPGARLEMEKKLSLLLEQGLRWRRS